MDTLKDNFDKEILDENGYENEDVLLEDTRNSLKEETVSLNTSFLFQTTLVELESIFWNSNIRENNRNKKL